MKNATARGQPGVAFSNSSNTNHIRTAIASAPAAPAQDLHQQLTADNGIPIACFWKSPRDRTRAVQVTLKSYQGHAYVDSRIYAMGPDGRMRPTEKGIAIGVTKLPQFAAAIGNALRKAHTLGLITARSS
jgi:Transcriptional Coactivator p15 (PC4)